MKFEDQLGYDAHLNAEGLACPLPLLKAKQGLNQMMSGKVLYVTTTDPASLKDINTFAKQAGHTLIKQENDQQTFHFWIKKA